MVQSYAYDSVIVGSGPNGLAAAITMAQNGRSVAVFEAEENIGGSVRSADLTLPGFVHDICSAVYPLAIGSPFFRSLPLVQHGLEWVQPPAALAHPLDDGTAVTLERSIAETASALGSDRDAYRKLMSPLIANWDGLDADLLGPPRLPRHPWNFTRFGLLAIQPARRLAESRFRGARARALFAGLAAHSMLPLEKWGSAAFGLVLGITGHAVGWPIAKGGAQTLANALASYLRSLGGEIFPNERVGSLDQLPSSRVILCDLTPCQLLKIAGARLSPRYRGKLARYRYGMGAFKNVGGELREIAASELAAWRREHAEKPFALVVQPSLFDPSRAPANQHTLWVYCHVPNRSAFDMTDRIEAQIERFAPGFRETIIARRIAAPAELERRNANLVGGDINGGAANLAQLFLRPTYRLYSTSHKGLYLCSASTPPGGGVHGMCGYFAARRALRDLF